MKSRVQPSPAPHARFDGSKWATAGIICALLGAFGLGATAQQPYRWVDENGVMHFSDRPQPDEAGKGTVGQELERRSAAQRAADEAARAAALEEAIASTAVEADQVDAEPAEAAGTTIGSSPGAGPGTTVTVESQWTCEQAKAFQAYFSGTTRPIRPLYTADAQGNYQPASAAQITRLADEWTQAAAVLCQPGITLKKPAAKVAPPGAEPEPSSDLLEEAGSASSEETTEAPEFTGPDFTEPDAGEASGSPLGPPADAPAGEAPDSSPPSG